MQLVFVYICIYLLLLVDDAVLKLMLHREGLNGYMVFDAAFRRDVRCPSVRKMLLPCLADVVAVAAGVSASFVSVSSPYSSIGLLCCLFELLGVEE